MNAQERHNEIPETLDTSKFRVEKIIYGNKFYAMPSKGIEP